MPRKYIPLIVVLVAIVGFVVFQKTKEQPVGGDTTPPPELLQRGEPHQQTIQLADGTRFSVTLPDGYTMMPAYQGLKRIRFMAWSPDGRLFMTDMKDLSDNSEGKVYVLQDFDAVAGRFKTIRTYLANLRNPNSIAFYKDRQGQQWLYVALTDHLVRYRYSAGDNAPTGDPQILATFPDYGLSYKYGGWHLTRTIAIQNDKIYVSVGSSCNACEEKPEETRAEIVVMNPDGSDLRTYADGLRNAVGLKFVGNDLWATGMGVDHLGDDEPNDLLYRIGEGTNHGWPHCYESDGRIYPDTTKSWKEKIVCTQQILAQAEFEAHSAPLGLEYFGDAFLVALHGSGNMKLNRGNKIVKVMPDGRVSDFITGFGNATKRYARPADILADPTHPGSFFFTDDFGGTLYYVQKQ